MECNELCPPIPRWSDERTALEAAGLTHPDDLEMARRAGAHDRHCARVAAAIVALADYCGGDGRAMHVVSALELQGIGGVDGIEGRATARMSWAKGLGKGRKQACDGDAWTAAIAEAATQCSLYSDLTPATVRQVAESAVIAADMPWVVAYARAQRHAGIPRVRAAVMSPADHEEGEAQRLSALVAEWREIENWATSQTRQDAA
jgi:hypothetical protein